jgi:hypothetical protein
VGEYIGCFILPTPLVSLFILQDKMLGLYGDAAWAVYRLKLNYVTNTNSLLNGSLKLSDDGAVHCVKLFFWSLSSV